VDAIAQAWQPQSEPEAARSLATDRSSGTDQNEIASQVGAELGTTVAASR